MTLMWTSQQVLALAPDEGFAKRGKALANRAKWPLLGCAELAGAELAGADFDQSARAIWGECQGSGKEPYRTIIALGPGGGEPAFRCSCPSRKFPCKHGLALFLLLVEQADFKPDALPEWGAQWLNKRAQTATQKQEKQKKSDSDPVAQTQQVAQAEKRAEQRLAKVEAGLVDLDQWLQDRIRQGLVSLLHEPYSFWDQAAARLVDAQMPGLARRLRELSGVPHSGEGWPERLLKGLGQLHLLVQGYGQLAKLSPEMQAEVRSQIGFPQTQEMLRNRVAQADSQSDPQVQCLADTWLVLGQVITTEEALKVQRLWLWGVKHQQVALVLSFAHGSRQAWDVSLLPGACFEGELIFYPGTGVKRAFVASRQAVAPSDRRSDRTSDEKSVWETFGFDRVEDAIAHYRQTLSQNPWTVQFPLTLRQSFPQYQHNRWWLADGSGQSLPLTPDFGQGWEMLAIGGGHPLTVFGEWDGTALLPLSLWCDQTFMALEGCQ